MSDESPILSVVTFAAVLGCLVRLLEQVLCECLLIGGGDFCWFGCWLRLRADLRRRRRPLAPVLFSYVIGSSWGTIGSTLRDGARLSSTLRGGVGRTVEGEAVIGFVAVRGGVSRLLSSSSGRMGLRSRAGVCSADTCSNDVFVFSSVNVRFGG